MSEARGQDRATGSTGSRVRKTLSVAGTIFVAVCTLSVVGMDRAGGGLLQAHFAEYAGEHRSTCKWRLSLLPDDEVISFSGGRFASRQATAEETVRNRRHHQFYDLLQWALLCWPVGIITVGLAVFESRSRRAISVVAALAIIASLAVLGEMGAPEVAQRNHLVWKPIATPRTRYDRESTSAYSGDPVDRPHHSGALPWKHGPLAARGHPPPPNFQHSCSVKSNGTGAG